MCVTIADDIRAIGVEDFEIDLFEGQFTVPDGVRYNSYVVLDEKVAVFDTVSEAFLQEWLDRLQDALAGRTPDYLVVQHMEPDHSAQIAAFMELYPDAKLVASMKAFAMMKNFFGQEWQDRRVIVNDGDTLALGRHTLKFMAAPMVHWPEVVVTYDETAKVLFSADAFGSFGTAPIAGDPDEDWAPEARRYYFGIVGKFGMPVQRLLGKAAALDIQKICPLHGPVLEGAALARALELYGAWAAYKPEKGGVLVAYTSVYGHTRAAAQRLAELLREKNVPEVVVRDLARCDLHEAVAQAFRLDALALATTTYAGSVYPAMRIFLDALGERTFQNRTVGLVENGSWAPTAAKGMRDLLASCKGLSFLEPEVHIHSALATDSLQALERLADALAAPYAAAEAETASAPRPPRERNALFAIGYGLYAATTRTPDGRDNACILNSVVQVTDSPERVAVTISKLNYTHHLVRQTGRLALNCLAESAPFALFQRFGFQSGRALDKFAGDPPADRTASGLAVLGADVANAVLSLKADDYIDLGTHGLFLCTVEEARVLSSAPTMTYAYYQANVKPKPAPSTTKKVRWVCKICGYVYEGDELPPDFVCPLCKHPASDFERIEG